MAQQPSKVEKPAFVTPPDGGWGWAVVFGSFMIQFFADGVSYGYLGLLYAQVVRDFGASKSAASWIGSISLGFTFGSGPIAGALVDRFGCRVVSIVGSVVAAFGFGSSYFAKDVIYLYFSVGITGGLGLGLVYLPAMVCISYYFEKKRAFATGIAVAGSGIGSFALAPLFALVYSLLVVAAVLLLCVVFGALFRPLNPTAGSVSVRDKAVQTDSYPKGSTFLVTAADNAGGYESGSVALTLDEVTEGIATVDLIADAIATTRTVETVPSGAELDGEEDDEALKKLLDSAVGDEEKPQSCCGSCCATLKSMLDFRVMLVPAFALFAVSNFLTNFGTNVPYIQLADLTIHNLDLEENDQTVGLIVGSVGISNSICRLVLGYLSDKKWMNRLYLYSISLILAGAVVGATSHAMSVETMTVCAVLFGATGGLYVGLTPIVLADLLGLERLSNSFGIVLLFQGLGTVIGAPVVGALYDRFGSYTYGFWLAGIIIAISGAMIFFIPCLQRWKKERPEEMAEIPHPGGYVSLVSSAKRSLNPVGAKTSAQSQRSVVEMGYTEVHA